MPSADQNGTTSSDTLQGWKDIANYLGRSTRAVQRWEDELKLPVHRIQGANGPTVYALKKELDDWKKSRDLPKPTMEEAAEIATAANHHAVANASTPTWRLPALTAWRWVAAAAVALLLVGLGVTLGVFIFARTTANAVASVHTVNNSVIAYDSLGHPVWTHDFGQPVSYTNADAGSGELHYTEIPVQGGRIGTVVALRFGPPSSRPSESDALVAFDPSGAVLWKVQPHDKIQCGADEFGGPWRIYSTTASTGLGPRRVWAAFNDPSWWPGVVMEVDAQGRSSIRMVSTGWIWDVMEWRTASRDLLAVAGANSEQARPSLSLIDLDGNPVMTPHADPRFACASMPKGGPTRVYLLPIPDTGTSDHAWAQGLTPLGSGLKVQVFGNQGNAVMEFGSDLSLRSFNFSDSYWTVHRDKESAGVIHHTAASCPERTRPQPLEEWTAERGWAHSTIMPTVRQSILTK